MTYDVDPRKVPPRFRTTCGCCGGEGSHMDCSPEGLRPCAACRGSGRVVNEEGRDFIRFVDLLLTERVDAHDLP